MRNDKILGKLPDPFIFDDGSRVQNVSDWERRRKEILDSVITTEFGGMPPKPEVFRVEQMGIGSKTSTYSYRIHCGSRAYPFTFCFSVRRVPDEQKHPVILTGDAIYCCNLNDEVTEEALRRGYHVAKFNRVELAPDMYNTDRDCGIYPIWPNLRFSAISAWAWGYQRVVDALLTLDYVDPTQIAITGHSRGGKTVLLAGATDERITYVNPNGSGTHGCGCYRFEQQEEPGRFKDDASERLEFMFRAVPYWMGDGLRQYVDHEADLPYDMHFIKALVAPRFFLETNGYEDTWGNPRGSYLTHIAAKEVWKLYGCPERCQTWYREGGHAHRWRDLNAFFDFIDACRLGFPLREEITRKPYTDMEPLHDWCAPEK